ncbi:MAG TPA: 4-hydroxy-3-methylbut-2-enyl diphosphate reductase, partial [Arenibaculum sp.]|nr:4-hydroxy-3-methylbut-2-enyl diphosphate reductase [Arenibaculum sp.]
AGEIDWSELADMRTLGITAGASAPDVLVREVLAAARERFEVTIEEITIGREDVVFKLPRVLLEPAPHEAPG